MKVVDCDFFRIYDLSDESLKDRERILQDLERRERRSHTVSGIVLGALIVAGLLAMIACSAMAPHAAGVIL